ncbi:protein shisa-4-like isoform X1 [Anguilla anguilla]|uniref:protein shisa-4-like isoform X1 n=1 Tax=Anguilla anguilla TaxID=7936 RepID=UPI0015B365F5|nr:protein shisa-4-like isoform X1 [Anguilla anguilla]
MFGVTEGICYLIYGKMSPSALVLPLLATVLYAWQASADEDCLSYVDKNGTWHNGFDCPLISFCCGTCQHRYCCLDDFKMIREREQKRCMLFQISPTTMAGIASSVLLFVVIISTLVCCSMCSCCYMYRRRRELRQATPCEGQQIPMASYPGNPMYDAHGKPIGQPEYQYPAFPTAPAPPGQLSYQPGIPQPYPAMVPGPYPPYPPVNPEYAPSPPPPYSPPQYPGN